MITRLNYTRLFWLMVVLLMTQSCYKRWDDHFEQQEPTVNSKIIEALDAEPRYSEFVDYMKQYGLDTILKSDKPKTLFVPANEAFGQLTTEDTLNFMKQILTYHVSPTIFLSNNLTGNKQLLSHLKKFIFIQQLQGNILVDGIEVSYSSPLYLDGKIYELPEVAIPKPSIYGYLELYNPFLKKYLDSFDTLYLDKSRSIPLGYNDQGETIYDSVYIKYNLFEQEYFPISEEFRSRKATIILFTQEQYDGAIEVMATNMGISTEDIPEKWQREIFLPEVVEKYIFEGSLEFEEFIPDLLNIKGDTSFIKSNEINPESRFLCSNGTIFEYLDFRVPEHLYLEKRKFEAEDFVKAIGLGRYIWNSELVTVTSDIATVPAANISTLASNDTIISVNYQFDYTGKYTIEFTLNNVFPGDYVVEWRGNYRPSGNFKLYVNSVDVTETSPMSMDGSFDLYLFRNLIASVVAGTYYIPDNDRNNSVDFLAKDIITEYGSVKVKIEYQDSGSQSNNGLNIDYIALTPYQN